MFTRDRDTDRQTDRQRQTQTVRHGDRGRDTQRKETDVYNYYDMLRTACYMISGKHYEQMT